MQTEALSLFEQARKNMVDCQIHTMGVINPQILKAFRTFPREMFVPDQMQKIAYNDEDLKIFDNRYMLEPAVHARMLEAISPRPDDVALDIGGAAGYSSAILGSIVSTVIALEENPDFINYAQTALTNLGVCNVVHINDMHHKGHPENAPYDIIFINGAIYSIPQNLINQLAPGGRMVAVIKKSLMHLGQATLIKKVDGKGYATYSLFEAGCPYLKGFEPSETFSF